MADTGGMLEKFGQFLEAQAKAEQESKASEYDSDDFEWWSEDKDGNRQGARTTVRAARQHAPEFVKALFAEKEDDKAGQGDGQGDGQGGGKQPKTLFPRTKPPAGSQGS